MKAWMILGDVSVRNYVHVIIGNWGQNFTDLVRLL